MRSMHSPMFVPSAFRGLIAIICYVYIFYMLFLAYMHFAVTSSLLEAHCKHTVLRFNDIMFDMFMQAASCTPHSSFFSLTQFFPFPLSLPRPFLPASRIFKLLICDSQHSRSFFFSSSVHCNMNVCLCGNW